MASGKRFFAVVLLFVGLYILISWGLLGHDAFADVQAKTSTTPSGTGGITKNSPLSASLFGVNAGFNGFGEDLSFTVRNADSAGLRAMGSTSPFAHDFDYGANPGSPIRLPGSSNMEYQYLGNESGPWGNLIYFRTPNGGVFGMPHVENTLPLNKNDFVAGGTIVGTVGKGPYNPTYWTGPHLSVITDQTSLAWFNKLASGL